VWHLGKEAEEQVLNITEIVLGTVLIQTPGLHVSVVFLFLLA
jgi:UPF0716 family protein affecting phage T7 exclusion